MLEQEQVFSRSAPDLSDVGSVDTTSAGPVPVQSSAARYRRLRTTAHGNSQLGLDRSRRQEPHEQHDHHNRKREIQSHDPPDQPGVASQFTHVIFGNLRWNWYSAFSLLS